MVLKATMAKRFFLGNHHKGHVASIVQPRLASEATRGRPEEREVLAFHSGMTLSFRQRAVARSGVISITAMARVANLGNECSTLNRKESATI